MPVGMWAEGWAIDRQLQRSLRAPRTGPPATSRTRKGRVKKGRS